MNSLNKQILRLAWPVIWGQLGMLAFDLVDVFWIAKLGTETVAGVAAAAFLDWAVYSFMGITTIGCATLVSQAVGAQNQKEAYDVSRESFHLGLLVSLFLLFVLWFGASSIFHWMGLDSKAHAAALAYYQVLILGTPVFFAFILTGQIFNAYGDTKTSNLILTGAIGLNALLDPFFIFGWGSFPKWGAFGAAFATLISFAVGMGVRLYFLRKKGYVDSLATYGKLSQAYFYRILSIGIPTASARVIWSLVYPLLSTLITPFGMSAMAALTMAHRIEGFAYCTAYGFSVAVSTLVGQNIGRKDSQAAREVAYQGKRLITFILLPMSLVFLSVPELLISFVSSDPEVISHGASYLRIIGLLEVFLGWEMVFEGGFNGVGETRPYMLISVPLTLGRYPLAYFLVNALGGGIHSIWWAISLSTLSKGICLNLAFEKLKAFKVDIPHAFKTLS
ncbi:MAG: MATE family efflux transporter [Deltaproteobacteria bacterium]|nr:MATE family efflux transporter [Deltaproteobacteria bacterium]